MFQVFILSCWNEKFDLFFFSSLVHQKCFSSCAVQGYIFWPLIQLRDKAMCEIIWTPVDALWEKKTPKPLKSQQANPISIRFLYSQYWCSVFLNVYLENWKCINFQWYLLIEQIHQTVERDWTWKWSFPTGLAKFFSGLKSQKRENSLCFIFTLQSITNMYFCLQITF